MPKRYSCLVNRLFGQLFDSPSEALPASFEYCLKPRIDRPALKSKNSEDTLV
jgi:hypothetical protein